MARCLLCCWVSAMCCMRFVCSVLLVLDVYRVFGVCGRSSAVYCLLRAVLFGGCCAVVVGCRVGVCCSRCGVYRVLFGVVCGLLFVVWCALMFVVCCFAACRLLLVVCGLVACCLVYVVDWFLCVVRCVFAVCCSLSAVCCVV